MATETLRAIADIYKKHDPEDADFYTLEWVRGECAFFNKSPEEVLADLLESEARAAAREPVTGDQPWVKDLPPHYVMKLAGPIDGFSYKLMEESGELAGLEKSMEQARRAEKG